MKPDPIPDAIKLRRHAEERLQSRAPLASAPRSANETQLLLHDLQVRQIELELHNEELRNSLEELQMLKERYASFYDFSPTGLVSLARNGTIVQINRAGARLLDRDRARLAGERFELFVAAADRPVFDAFLQQVFATGAKQTCEAVIVPNGGSRVRAESDRPPMSVHIEAELSPDKQECRAAVVDITARKQVEVEREQYFKFFTTSSELMGICYLHGTFKKVNPAFTKILGYSETEILAVPFIEFVHPEDRERTLEEMARLRQQAIPRDFENRYIHKDGSIRWLSWSADVIREEGLIYATARDITERKQAEAKIQASQRNLAEAQQMTHLGSWDFDLVRNRLRWSTEMFRIFGVPPEEFRATLETFLDTLHPDDRDWVDQAYKLSLRAGGRYDIEYRIVRKSDGQLRWGHARCEHERDAQGNVLRSVGTVQDITERKMQQDSLERQVRERTAQLRTMAMELTMTEERERHVVAQELHDGLGQSLAVAKLKLSALIPSNDNSLGNSELKRKVTTIEDLIDEANQTVHSLSLQLSPPMLHEHGLVPTLGWLADEMQNCYGLRVNVHDDGLPKPLDEIMLHSLFRATRELLINVARHAQADVAELTAMRAEDRLVLSVTDTGVGFDAHNLSTPSAKGGYGLFSIRERVGFIGGDVQIDSSPGDGTVVVLTVPLAAYHGEPSQ